jgi:hypothetical protein
VVDGGNTAGALGRDFGRLGFGRPGGGVSGGYTRLVRGYERGIRGEDIVLREGRWGASGMEVLVLEVVVYRGVDFRFRDMKI